MSISLTHVGGDPFGQKAQKPEYYTPKQVSFVERVIRYQTHRFQPQWIPACAGMTYTGFWREACVCK